MSHYSAIIRVRLSEDDLGQASAMAQELASQINDGCFADCADVIEVAQEEEVSQGIDKVLLPLCEVPGCESDAAYEGWARKADPMASIVRMAASGMMRLFKVCEGHKQILIGFQKETGLSSSISIADVKG